MEETSPSGLSATSLGRRTNPLLYDPLNSSPCKLRPDTGLPCPLIQHPKTNKICLNCGLINTGKPIVPVEEIKKFIFNSSEEEMDTVPEEKVTQPSNIPQTADHSPKIKQCTGPCGRTLPADQDHFRYMFNTKDKLTSLCLDCIGKKIASGRNSSKKKPSKTAKPVKKPPEKPGLRISDLSFSNDSSLFLDFRQHEDILDALKNDAASQMRTPELQAMFIIKQAICQ